MNEVKIGNNLRFVLPRSLFPSLPLSVCRSVGRSVTHSFDDPHVAPIGLLGLVFLHGDFGLESFKIFQSEICRNLRISQPQKKFTGP